MPDKAPLYFSVRLGGLFPASAAAEEAMRELHMLLDCDFNTGVLTWRKRTADRFSAGKQSAEHNCAIWNGRFAGSPALNSPDKRGYLTGHLNGAPVKAHRIIWALAYGEWPDEIDHINGDPSDNRLCNLRAVSHAQNGRNLRLKRTNTSGACGVYRRPSGRWYARITVGGVARNLGTFDTKAQAVAAQRIAAQDAGFHANHGRRS